MFIYNEDKNMVYEMKSEKNYEIMYKHSWKNGQQLKEGKDFIIWKDKDGKWVALVQKIV